MHKLLDAGKAVRKSQVSAGISNAEFARLAKTSPQQVIRWRTQPNMKLHTIELICESLGTDILSFLNFAK